MIPLTPEGRHLHGTFEGVMSGRVLVASAVLLGILVGGGLWISRGYAALGHALQSFELRDDLSQAHTSLLGARVDLYERDYFAASRKLERARELLRRAQERGIERHAGAVVTPHDLVRFEADLDEAQRLLARLDQDAGTSVPQHVIGETPMGAPLVGTVGRWK